MFSQVWCVCKRKEKLFYHLDQTIDYLKQSFTASFSVDGDNPYSEDITGTIQKDRVWASSSDYEYNISFKVNWKNSIV